MRNIILFALVMIFASATITAEKLTHNDNKSEIMSDDYSLDETLAIDSINNDEKLAPNSKYYDILCVHQDEPFSWVKDTDWRDLVDYYLEGIKVEMPTSTDGTVRLDSLAILSFNSHYADYAHLTFDGETTLELLTHHISSDKWYYFEIETVYVPMPYSRIETEVCQYSNHKFVAAVELPELNDFFTTKDKKAIERLTSEIKLPITYMHFDPQGNIIVKPSFVESLPIEVRQEIEPLLRDSIVLKWNGKKYVKAK